MKCFAFCPWHCTRNLSRFCEVFGVSSVWVELEAKLLTVNQFPEIDLIGTDPMSWPVPDR
jgi:hypothetical protein